MNNYLSPMEQVNVLSSILYNMYKLENEELNVDNINHYFISYLLSAKTGNIYSLGAVYLSLCRLLHIPIYAVDIPQQFLLGYFETTYNYLDIREEPTNNILFYIDPANGMVYTQSDVNAYLKKINYEPIKDDYKKPLDNKKVMLLYFQQLLKCYETDDLINQKEKEILQIIELLRD